MMKLFGDLSVRRCYRLRRHVLALILVSSIAGFGGITAGNASPGFDSGQIMAVLGQLLANDNAVRSTVAVADLPALRRFYKERDYSPAWVSQNGLTEDALLARQALAHADDEGLNPADYDDGLQVPVTAQGAARYDLLLTDSFLRYARDVRLGRIAPDAVYNDIGLPVQVFDPVSALTAALKTHTVARLIADLPPPHAEYAQLKAALARYRAIAAAGGWPQIPGQDELKLDGNDPRLAVLSRRLAIEDPTLLQGAPVDMGTLRDAVERFQARNGLHVDGRVGRQTLYALNVSAPERVAQITANMERWRGMPRSFGPRYIAVNAADATLQVVDNGKVILTSRVIVGKPHSPTAIFAATVIAITINPYWNIPAAIARNETIPKARRHPGYLAANHIIVSSSGRLRQLPGPDNSLGQIKLEMPNRFDAYLHDTPARKLFEADERHLSHGCIRVEQIQPLASFALTGDAAAGLENIQAAIATGANQRISLDNPLPVYVLYWTAIADQDGMVDFRSDVYGRDQKLLAALAGRHLMGRMSMNTSDQCRRA